MKERMRAEVYDVSLPPGQQNPPIPLQTAIAIIAARGADDPTPEPATKTCLSRDCTSARRPSEYTPGKIKIETQTL